MKICITWQVRIGDKRNHVELEGNFDDQEVKDLQHRLFRRLNDGLLVDYQIEIAY